MEKETVKIKVADLEIGDKVIRDSDEAILTVSKIVDKGFGTNSVFIDYKEGGWTSISKTASIKKLKN